MWWLFGLGLGITICYIVFKAWLSMKRYGAMLNAVMAKHIFTTLSRDEQKQIKQRAIQILKDGGVRESEKRLKDMWEPVKFCFLGLAMSELGYASLDSSKKWVMVRNPFIAGGADRELWMAKNHLKKNCGIDIEFEFEKTEAKRNQDEKGTAFQELEDVHESDTIIWENLFKDIEKANSAAADTCWHQLRQIICCSADGQEYRQVVKTFLIPDSISPAKFRVNALHLCGWLSYLHAFKVSFNIPPSQSVAALSSVKDIKPLGFKAYPYWFLAAYPDVVMWAANIFTFDFKVNDLCAFTTDDNVLRDIFGDIGRENELADGCFIKHKHLRALVEGYRNKTGLTLECRT